MALLQQISQQLPNTPNSANSNTAKQLVSLPGTAMVWVNILWLISLVLSLTCALIATLLQQWARSYIETPIAEDVPRHRARVRSLLIASVMWYKMPLIVEILPTLLHLSVFSFFGGLVITFHTIDRSVAIAVDIAVGLSGLAYIALSILPCLDVRCPYRTPISKMLWYPCHAFLSFSALCLHTCIWGLQGFLSLVLPSGRPRSLVSPVDWTVTHYYFYLFSGRRVFPASDRSDHRRYFRDGLKKSISSRAIQLLADEDFLRVTWLFNQLALGDRSKFLKFAASIPRHQIPDLILSTKLDSPPLVSLLVLLRSCVVDAYSGVDEDVRKRSLLVCLLAIRHVAKATPRDLNFMLNHLENTDHMEELLRNSDSFIRTTSHSICALVAQKVVRKSQLGEADLQWLREVTGKSPDAILGASITVRDQMNFKAFVSGVLTQHSLYPPGKCSAEETALFKETLEILLNERTNDSSNFLNQLSEEIEQIHELDPADGREVFDNLHAIFPSLEAPFPPRAPSPPGIPPPTHYVPPNPSTYYGSRPVIYQPPIVHVPPDSSPYYGPPRSVYDTRRPTIAHVPPLPQPIHVDLPTQAPLPPATVPNMGSSHVVPSAPPFYYLPPPVRPPAPPPVTVEPSCVSRAATPSSRSRSHSTAPRSRPPPTRCHLM